LDGAHEKMVVLNYQDSPLLGEWDG